MSNMKELLIDGFILRMKHQLSEMQMSYDEFKNLIENIHKFTNKFPELKGKIKNEFHSSISKFNNQQFDLIYITLEFDIKNYQNELNNILEYEKIIRAPSMVPSEVKSLVSPFKVVRRQRNLFDLNKDEKEKYDEIFNKMVKSKGFLIKIHNLKS